MIRSKFRCMSVTHHAEQGTSVKLLPVIGKTGSPDEAENRVFWKYTPSGEATVTFQEGAKVPFAVGNYYYLDIEPNVEHPWKFWELTQRVDSLTIKINLSWSRDRPLTHGEVQMQIDNKSAWPHFMGQVGTTWSVDFTEA